MEMEIWNICSDKLNISNANSIRISTSNCFPIQLITDMRTCHACHSHIQRRWELEAISHLTTMHTTSLSVRKFCHEVSAQCNTRYHLKKTAQEIYYRILQHSHHHHHHSDMSEIFFPHLLFKLCEMWDEDDHHDGGDVWWKKKSQIWNHFAWR